jgi:HSP20 family protein
MALPVRRSASPTTLTERWDPARELDELHNRVGQLMDSLWSGAAIGDGAVWSPLVDVEETDDAWVVEADLPGVKREDVNVEVRGNELIISGEIKERERKGILRRRTRRSGQFEYRVTLPGGADPGGIDASLDDGVLKVRVPKPEEARPRRIDVKPG